MATDTSVGTFKESHTRSILNGFSWRIIASCTTILVAYWVTGETETALKVGGIEFFGKIGIYYLTNVPGRPSQEGTSGPGLEGAPELKTQWTQRPEGQA